MIKIHTITEDRKTEDRNSDELHITHGYRNTKGEIYLAENEICITIETENEIQTITQELSSGYSEVDTNDKIDIEVVKIKNNKFKKIHLYIPGLLCKTIGLNEIGNTFDIDIDDGYEVNTETWTILSMQEIREKIDPNQEYEEI